MRTVIESAPRSVAEAARPPEPDMVKVAGGDPSPCLNPACRAPGWPLVAKPLNWPWAEHCWNCGTGLR